MGVLSWLPFPRTPFFKDVLNCGSRSKREGGDEGELVTVVVSRGRLQRTHKQIRRAPTIRLPPQIDRYLVVGHELPYWLVICPSVRRQTRERARQHCLPDKA